jgi:hypothetical protein
MTDSVESGRLEFHEVDQGRLPDFEQLSESREVTSERVEMQRVEVCGRCRSLAPVHEDNV